MEMEVGTEVPDPSVPMEYRRYLTPPSPRGLLIDNLNSQIIMGISIITNKTRRCMT